MTREELKALGIAEESTVNGIMVLHGKAMTEAVNKANLANERAEKAETELKKYQKGGEFYNDPKEIERLKTFEKDTLTRADRDKKTASLTKLFKSANASEGATKLLVSSQDFDKLEVDENGEVKNGLELLKKAKADYADLFSVNGNAGIPQSQEGSNNGNATAKKPAVY
jgi:hypothetical protein